MQLTSTSTAPPFTPARVLPVDFREWVGARSPSSFSTNVDSGVLAFQSWRNIKEAFAPELVARALTETQRKVNRVLDPFGGSGTTSLACQFLGVSPVTIELNPYLADLIESKLTPYDPAIVVETFARVVTDAWHSAPSVDGAFAGAPPTFVEPGVAGRYVFPRSVAQRILAYRQAIARLPSDALRRLFTILLGSTLIPASNVTVSGKGRRYRRNWQQRQKSPDDIDVLFQDLALRAIHDITRFQDRPCQSYEVLRGDARRLCATLSPFDLAVFSPPYPNSFDYTDVYNVELWGLGYLTSGSDNQTLRVSTVRSHVQVCRDMSTSFAIPDALRNVVEALRETSSDLWNPHIPDMIGAYFQDMYDVLDSLYVRLRPLGRTYLVVGDSQYGEVRVPVAKILSELAQAIGYTLQSAEQLRAMRASPQQGGRHQLAETLLVLEKPV